MKRQNQNTWPCRSGDGPLFALPDRGLMDGAGECRRNGRMNGMADEHERSLKERVRL